MYPVQFLSMSSCSGVDSSLSHCPYSYLQKILSHCRLAYYTCIFFNLFVLFIYYFWLCWVSVAARELSLVAVSGGYSSLQGAGFSLRWLLLLQSTGSRCAGFSSCGAPAYLLRGMWDLPGPKLEPVSPALAGGFLTTAPPGKPYMCI